MGPFLAVFLVFLIVSIMFSVTLLAVPIGCSWLIPMTFVGA